MAPVRSPLALAVGGAIALAAAMGIGRFLYTPALPMMVEGTGLDPAGAGLLASANFAGHLVGALAASLPGLSAIRARPAMLAALALSGLTTGAMALTGSALAWAGLRFVGGIASAFVLVLGSALILARLGQIGRPGLAALYFGGVGVGISISALISAPGLLGPTDWALLWLIGGALTLGAVGPVAWLVPPTPPVAAALPPDGAARRGLWRMVLAYGCLGLGYVITATFIVAILRDGAAGRGTETAVWLLVGIAAAPSVWLWLRVADRIGAIRAWQAAMLVEAAGVALSAVSSGAIALMLAAVALGGTFIGLTALGLREAARRAGGDGRAAMGLMTAAFGVGQIVGPALGGWLRDSTGSYALPSLIAAATLAFGALVVQPLARR